MTELKEKIKTGLDEDRMLVLVVQVLLGFEYRAVFEKGFEKLAPAAQYLKLTSAGLLLFTLALLLTVPAYHRIVEQGEATGHFRGVLRRIMQIALTPFAAALGIDLAIVASKLFGPGGAMACGIVTAGAALFFWYGIEMMRSGPKKRGDDMHEHGHGKTPLADKIKQILTEARIVLPGAQALLGFQLSTFLTEGFDKLPHNLQLTHLAALACVALSAILLMTPPAYHRIVENGEDTPHFHRLANRFVVGAMIPLALGIATDFYVVVTKVTTSEPLGLSLGAVALAMFYGLWFAFPLLRSRTNGHALVPSTAN